MFSAENLAIIWHTMKTIAIHLRLATASHRKRMMGIFRFFGSAQTWNIHIVPDEEHLCSLLQSAQETGIPDGIISGVPLAQRTKDLMAKSKIPFVGIGMDGDEFEALPHAAGFVVNDNTGIGESAAGYFRQLGEFRSYAFVGDLHKRPWSVLRGKAFARKLASAGKTCKTYDLSGSPELDRSELSAFLSRLAKPAAVFAAWDGRAADVLNAASCAGLNIPGDIAVLGVDDDQFICEHAHPTISSIKTDAEGMGEAAAEMLSRFLHGKTKRRIKAVCRHPLGVVERASTHSPAPAARLIQRAIAFIEAEAANGIHPDDVADHLKVSRRLLDLRFKQYETQSLAEKITACKLENAKRLLADPAISVKAVFLRSGFTSIPHANRIFKELTGLAPATWRKQLQQHETARTEGGKRSGKCFEILSSLTDAEASDMGALAGLLDPSARFDIAAVRSAIQTGTAIIIVKRHRGRIVASATIARFSTPTGTHHRIEDVIVDAKLRGKGIGRRLMEYALEHLRQSGAESVELTSRPSRIAANALYRSLGFKTRKTNVYRLRFRKTPPEQSRSAVPLRPSECSRAAWRW